MPRLAIIFQNVEPLIKKGSIIKSNYFNPSNFFDEIHMLTFDRALSKGQTDLIQGAFGKAEVRYHPIGGFNFHNVYFRRASISRMLADINPDVIRTYSPLIDGYLATYSGRRLGIPVVISLHGDRDRDNRYNMRAEGKYGAYLVSLMQRRLFEKPSLRSCSHIVAMYEFAAEYGRRYSEKPVTVIYNKVDTNEFHPSSNEANSQFTVINVGRMIPAKNQRVLIAAMQHVDGKLILIGSGPMVKEIQAQIATTHMEGKVEMIGAIPNNAIASHYRRAHVYATAIRYGGVAIPVLEAMASGLPVVQCPPPHQPVPEFIGDAGLVVECTPEGFAQGINKLKDDIALRMSMGRAAREKMEHHDSKQMDELESAVYRKVIEMG
jgi:glycosyltransferase involved in cell wall biosynthesis